MTARFTVLLVLLTAGLTGVLAYRAHQAARGHRAFAEQTLREYAAFAAFELKNATLNRMSSQHRIAMDRVLRTIATREPIPPLPIERVAELVTAQGTLCDCLSGARFFYSIAFPDSAVAATPSPLATPSVLAWLRDTVIADALAPDTTSIAPRPRPAPAPTPAPATDAGGNTRRSAPRTAITSAYYAALSADAGGTRLLFVHVLMLDAFGHPLVGYGFATDPEAFVGRAVRRVMGSQRLLPQTLTRGLPIDSVLSVTVVDQSGYVAFRSRSLDARFAATDTLAQRHGALRFQVAMNPAVANQLIIGGLPRSRLPGLVTLFVIAIGLLVLLLHQMRRQQELVRLRSEFVSGVSHELRTPLAQIRLLAELLRMGKIPTEERRERSLRIIDQEARRLTYLVEGILSFSGLDRGDLMPVSTEISTEVEEIVTGFEPLASAQRVRVVTQLDPTLVATVDRSALRQMLLNLLDNAVRYGPEGQTVTVTAARAENDAWQLVVQDEGRGIPTTERARVFEPYYRMQRDMASATGGSGIGLAVVRGLVEKHGGHVRIEDAAPGATRGTRFVIEMPIRGAAAVGVES